MESCAPAPSAARGARSAAKLVHRCVFTSPLLSLLAQCAALELELDVAKLDDVVVDQVVLLDLLVVDEGAVRAVEIGDLEFSALVPDGGVLAGDLLVGEHDVAVGRSSQD